MDLGQLTEAIVFFLFAAIAVLAALGVVIARSPIRAALSLALVFVSLAVMYVLLSAPFLAVAQVMIYAGAVLILFLFVIMVLNPRVDRVAWRPASQTVVAVIFAIALAGLLIGSLAASDIAPFRGPFTPEVIAELGHVQVIGTLLFTDYLLPFEIASVLLLVAIVGAMTLARREKEAHKNIEG